MTQCVFLIFQAILFGELKSAKTRFILSNKETIHTLFVDSAGEDNVVVYTMDEFYHQMERIAHTVCCNHVW